MVFAAIPGAQGGGELRVCPICGAVAPAGAPHCALCRGALGVRVKPVALPMPGRAWARLEVSLPCQRCGATVLARPESLDAPLPCAHCGHSNAVELGWWHEALHYAHAAADLSAPDDADRDALGPYNPFYALGDTAAALDLPSDRLPSSTPLRLRVGIGSPLCPRCASPVLVRSLRGGRSTAECTGCGEREAFALTEALASQTPALRAVVAYGAEAAAAQGRVEPWWLLFEGPSTLRPLVIAERERYLREEAEREAWAQYNLQERERQEREAQLAEAQRQREEAEQQRSERARQERAERERLHNDLKTTHAQLDEERGQRQRAEEVRQRLEGDLRTAREQFVHDRTRLQQEAQAGVEAARREAWQQMEQMRAHMAQGDAAWQARVAKLEADASAMAKRHKKRWAIAVVLWVIFFLVLAADVFLAVTSR